MQIKQQMYKGVSSVAIATGHSDPCLNAASLSVGNSPTRQGRRSVVQGTSFVISAGKTSIQREFMITKVLMNSRFDAFIGAVIFANALTIGAELTLRVRDETSVVITALEQLFLSIYIGELGIRFFCLRLQCLKDNWVKFDCVLVFTGCVTAWILEPIGTSLGPIVLLRMTRLLRLARTVRLLVKFRDLWMLVRGLLNSAGTMFYTCVLLIIILYVFACAAMELIATSEMARPGDSAYDEIFAEFTEDNFRNIWVSMITLVQFVTLDSIASIYRPMIERQPFLALYFMVTIIVIGIVLMNLITAVVVNGALEQASKDKEAQRMEEDKKKRKMSKDLEKIFRRLDEDFSGRVTREELENCNEEDKEFLKNAMPIKHPIEIFDALDVNQDRLGIPIDDFVNTIQEVALSEVPIELKRIEKQVNFMREEVKSLLSLHDEFLDILTQSRMTGLTTDDGSRSAMLPMLPSRKCHTPIIQDGSDCDAPAWARNLVLELRQVSREACAVACSAAVSEALKTGERREAERTMPHWAREMLLEIRRLPCTAPSPLAHAAETLPRSSFPVGVAATHTDAEREAVSALLSAVDSAALRLLQGSHRVREELPGMSARLSTLALRSVARVDLGGARSSAERSPARQSKSSEPLSKGG